MQEKIQFISDNITLEGLLLDQSADKAVIITHPHPLYGGDMYNFVVEAISRIYGNKGYTTLRFNFRGTGRSLGQFDNGDGEQQDVLAAYSYLSESGKTNISLAGYSFGAWVTARAVSSGIVLPERMIMVSPPVAFVDFESVRELSPLHLVVCGSNDDFAPADIVEAQLLQWNPSARLAIIHDTDHFYSGALDDLESVLDAAL